MIIAEMATFDNLGELIEMAEDLTSFVQEAVVEGTAAHEVENGVWQRVLAMGRQATGHFLRMQGNGDVGETIEMPEGDELRRLAEPLDKILGLSVPVDSLERMNRKMAESVAAFRDSLKKPPVKEEGSILVATADGKGIPMRRPADQRPVGARRKKGEKANKKQMATLGCVYTVNPKHRTADDVVEALFRERAEKRDESPEPVAKHKRVWSSLTYDEGELHVDAETEVFSWMTREAAARRRDGQPMICLMDGQRSLWASCASHLPRSDVVEILDLLHATEYVWNAAYLFHAEGSDAASAFVRDRVLRILRGEVGYVIGGLRQMATKRGLPAGKREKLTRICNYLEHNRHRMRYDEYLKAGYPIASGVIEGACRHVVKDRMERSGMRWTIDGAQAMLDLRCMSINGQWPCSKPIESDQKPNDSTPSVNY